MGETLLSRLEEIDDELAELDFKASFDPANAQDWCELVKDMVAMANSGGGTIVFGVNDDGTAASFDFKAVSGVDPATISDKIKKYTNQHVGGFAMSSQTRRGSSIVVLTISGVRIPIVFTSPEGTIFSIAPRPLQITDGMATSDVRLVADENAPTFNAVNLDKAYPYRQKELVARVRQLLGQKITTYDVQCIRRKVYDVRKNPNFSYKSTFSSPQYSDAFAQWIVDKCKADPTFLENTRDAARKEKKPTA